MAVAGARRRWGRASPVRGRESACKPGSVEDSHSSGTHVAIRLERPTRGHARAARRSPWAARPPIWSCSGWGLPCRRRCRRRGALLPHHFTLTIRVPTVAGTRIGGIFSVALSVGSRPPGVTWHPALWSPDFPPHRKWVERLPGRLPNCQFTRSRGKSINRLTWIWSPFPCSINMNP